MPFSLGRLTEELIKLKDRVPLTFKWHTGRQQPPVEIEQIVFWEDVDNEIAKIMMRRKSKVYIFTSYLADPATNITISVAAHAHRHATSGSSLADTGSDPLRPYNFTWDGAHTFSPTAAATRPITVIANASQSATLMELQSSASAIYWQWGAAGAASAFQTNIGNGSVPLTLRSSASGSTDVFRVSTAAGTPYVFAGHETHSASNAFFTVTGTAAFQNASLFAPARVIITSPGVNTAPGSVDAAQAAFEVRFNAGYTGTGGTYGILALNLTAGQGTSYVGPGNAGVGNAANYGLQGIAGATTIGTNLGFLGTASGGNENMGGYTCANQPKSGAKNIGNIGFARQNGGGVNPIAIAGYYGLWGPATAGGLFTVPDFVTTGSAALVASNGIETTFDIAKFCKGDTVQTKIDSEGRIQFSEVASPTHVANKGFLYAKDFSGQTELCFFDSNGAATGVEIRLTKASDVNAYVTVKDKAGSALTRRQVLKFYNGLDAADAGGESTAFVNEAFNFVWTHGHQWEPSAASELPIQITAHASQSVDLFQAVAPDSSDNVAINNEGILRLRDVSGLTGTYPGQAAPYGGLQDYGTGFSYCILYGMFDSTGSNLTELWFDNEANTPQKLTVNGRVNVDVNIDWNWQVSQTFAGGATISAGQVLSVNTIQAASGTVTTFLNDISVADSDIRTGTSTGTTIGLTGHKVGFMGATPIGAYTGGGIAGGFTAGAGAAVDSLSTWTGSGGVSGNTYTIGDIVDALKKFGFIT